MIDPISAISIATGAFNAVKSAIGAGRDIEDMAGTLGKWMGAVSDIKKAEEMNKKPPLFKKVFASGSVEEEAMQIFMAKKKAEDMREELRQIIVATRGPSAWDELIKTEASIRKKRQETIYAQAERRKQLIEILAVGALVLVIGGFIVFLIYLAANR
jgi:preprotein translocase subunit Sss1